MSFDVVRRAVLMNMIDAAGEPLATVGVGAANEARTVDGGCAIRDGVVEGLEFRDAAGEVVLRGATDAFRVMAGQQL